MTRTSAFSLRQLPVAIPRIAALGFTAMALAACALRPIHLATPPASAPASSPDSAEVVVFRRGWFGGLVSPGVFINDNHIGNLGVANYVHHRIPPGQVKMFVGTEARCEASFPAEPGRTYFFNVRIVSGWWLGRPQLELLDPAEGSAWVASGDYGNASFEEPKPFEFELRTSPDER